MRRDTRIANKLDLDCKNNYIMIWSTEEADNAIRNLLGNKITFNNKTFKISFNHDLRLMGRFGVLCVEVKND